MNAITIAIDAMGGDFGPPVTVPASLKTLTKHPELRIQLVGDSEAIEQALNKFNHPYDPSRLKIVHASQSVEMHESPALALRNKKDSSMRVAINLVKENEAKACVSAGNTGALMATARFVLKTLPGIDRPAIISSFPTKDPKRCVRMLDLGANIDTTPESLFQFAVMGSVLASIADNIKTPKVYLLNIGEEEIKGNELVKQAAQLLANNSSINYQGFIEGDAIHSGEADVVVCDGFVGNVTLKTMEGVARFITQLIRDAFMQNGMTKIVGFLAKPILKKFLKRIDPSKYNGATLIGLQGTVIKSHGSADINSFSNAIEEAYMEGQKNLPEEIHAKIELIMKSNIPSNPEDKDQ